jgi:hypothetical protein
MLIGLPYGVIQNFISLLEGFSNNYIKEEKGIEI